LKDTSSLTVNHVVATSIAISPKTAFIKAGDKQGYNAIARTPEITYGISLQFRLWLTDQTASGSGTQNIRTSHNSKLGRAGKSNSKSDTSQLTVCNKIDFNHGGNFFLDTITYVSFIHITLKTKSTIQVLNGDGKIDFTDLVSIASPYIVYK
jgi:hypothetical protein